MRSGRWPWRADSRWLRAFTLASTALAALICLIVIWPADRWWATAPLTWAPHLQWAALPALLTLWSILAASLRWALVNFAVAALILLGPAGLEIGGAPVHDEDILVVVTHNLAGRTAMVPKLRDHWLGNCDVLCVQEARVPEFEELLTAKDGYDHAAVGALRTFVRGRIIETDVIGPAEGTHREFLACEAIIRGRRVSILNVHLATNVEDVAAGRGPGAIAPYLSGAVAARDRQHRLIEDWLGDQSHPTIVLGDFNTPPRSVFYRRLSGIASDSFAAVGRGFGYTYQLRSMIPAIRIDYVWCARGTAPNTCTTGGGWASDHLWVEARVGITQPESIEQRE